MADIVEFENGRSHGMGICPVCNKKALICTIHATVTDDSGTEGFQKTQCAECLSEFIMKVRAEWPEATIKYCGQTLDDIYEGVRQHGLEGFVEKIDSQEMEIYWRNGGPDGQ